MARETAVGVGVGGHRGILIKKGGFDHSINYGNSFAICPYSHHYYYRFKEVYMIDI